MHYNAYNCFYNKILKYSRGRYPINWAQINFLSPLLDWVNSLKCDSFCLPVQLSNNMIYSLFIERTMYSLIVIIYSLKSLKWQYFKILNVRQRNWTKIVWIVLRSKKVTDDKDLILQINNYLRRRCIIWYNVSKLQYTDINYRFRTTVVQIHTE